MNGLIVIPARWGSTRLPGKPLLPIAGRTLLSRTCDAVRRATAGVAGVRTVVATDDERIAAEARTLGIDVAITDAALSSGSARALAAAKSDGDPPLVINVQGDTPFIPSAAVSEVIVALRAGAAVATPVVQLSWSALTGLREHKRTSPFSGTTCIVDDDGNARWFSKQILPALRDEPRLRAGMSMSPVLRHVGLYGYTLDALERYEAAPPSRYERMEGLEQLRFFELGIAIRTVRVDPTGPFSMSGIDTREDIALAERLIAEHGDPFGS